MLDISIVVPLYNEAESLPELEAWIDRVMAANGYKYEVIFVDDGSTDMSWEVIQSLRQKNPNVRGISFRRNYGKSPALNTGFSMTRGRVVITMDADLQDSPDEIPELYRMITEDGYDLVSGWKQKRYDPLSKTIPTKLFNATARRVSGIRNLHDFNCGLKAYRAEVVKRIEVYGDMHRYIPYLAKNAGFKRIGEKVVQHQARKIRVDKVRSGPFCERISGSGHSVVHIAFRSKTNAFFRPDGLPDVSARSDCGSSGGRDKTIQDDPWHVLRSCHGLTLFLPVTYHDDTRIAVLSGRVCGRACGAQLSAPQ